jgi:two-component system chemotaxis sensor kinase CheA
MTTAADPYKYFRVEARELVDGIARGILEIERDGPTKELVSRLLRLAHTLKGAARIVKLPRIAQEAHTIEDALAPLREGTNRAPASLVNGVLGAIDRISADLVAIDGGRAGGGPVEESKTATDRKSSALDVVRVDLDQMEVLLDSVVEATVQTSNLRKELVHLEEAREIAGQIRESLRAQREGRGGARAALPEASDLADELAHVLERATRSIAVGLEQAGRELGQVRDTAHRFRLQPASAIFDALERAARDAAQALGKQVAFTTSGGEIRLDAHSLVALRDALAHVVRNAVAHGIETNPERAAASKPPVGKVTLTVERRGNDVAFVCRDDGRGIDVASLRREAVRAGALREADAATLADAALFRMLLKGGLTTARSLTEVSGRAIGLDAAREITSRLKGHVEIRSESGRGTSVEIRVPVSMSALAALLVDAEGITAAVPLESVRRTLYMTDEEITRSADGESIVHEARVIPFVPLARVLGRAPARRTRSEWSTVVVGAGDAIAAVGVDRMLGTEMVVLRPLPPHAKVDATIAGASLDAEGTPQLVLDPEGLVAAARSARGGSTRSVERAPALPILVIDDSLTTRMLEQSILESAGYEVQVATSGEEGIEKARARRYGVFVVDVEMPGMSGFEFVAMTRADPTLRETPAVLVTSRDAPEDKQRGRDAGARGYIVKGEFEQERLLQTIRELLGSK